MVFMVPLVSDFVRQNNCDLFEVGFKARDSFIHVRDPQ